MSELKLPADSGGGSVSLKGPASTTSNADVPFVLPVADGSAGQYLKTDGSKNLSFATVSTDPTTTSGTNNFTVADGDLVIGTGGHGIDFSAQTQSSATTNSELLDHYEEGTFTPTLEYGSSTSGVAYSEQVGRYTRIGDVCMLSIRMTLSSNGSGSQNVFVSSLPFTPSTAGVNYHKIQLDAITGLNSGNASWMPFIQLQSGKFAFYFFEYGGTGNYQELNHGHIADNFSFHLTGYCFV